MSTKSNLIDGFRVELDLDEEWSDCYLSKRTFKGIFSGTLQFVEEHGELINGTGNSLKVSDATEKRIRKWAEANGY